MLFDVNNGSFTTTCTIITSNYLHYALALNSSLCNYKKIVTYVLIVDCNRNDFMSRLEKQLPDTIKLLFIDDVNTTDISHKLVDKYYCIDNFNEIRWTLKPILLIHLLNNYEKVLYLDCDLFFCNDYNFLFDELTDANILLTPHWRCINPYEPSVYENLHYKLLFLQGIYNAGFIGASKGGINALEWWAEVCEHACEKKQHEGFYDDQRYLDVLPVYFEGVKILKHRGCNLSTWNFVECKRALDESGALKINGIFDVIFIHFNTLLEEDILSGKDELLLDFYNKWKQLIGNFKDYSNPYAIEPTQGLSHVKINLEQRKTQNSDYYSYVKKSIKKILNYKTENKFLLPTFKNNAVPIVYSSDNNYAPFLAVSIKSVIENASIQNNYDFYILENGISNFNRKKILELSNGKANINIKFVEINEHVSIENHQFYVHSQFSIETYFRFFIQKIFCNFKKVIYLDPDTIVIDDIANLLNVDLGKNLLAATKDIDIARGIFVKRNIDDKDLISYLKQNLNIDNIYLYFQAGVLVFNIEEMMKMNIQNRLLLKLSELGQPLYVDQDIMNSVCQRKVKLLDYSWDVLWHMYFCYPNLENELRPDDYAKYKASFEKPKIIHYTSKVKPWKKPDLPLAEYFWKYAIMTPFYQEILDIRDGIATKPKKSFSDNLKIKLRNSAIVLNFKKPLYVFLCLFADKNNKAVLQNKINQINIILEGKK